MKKLDETQISRRALLKGGAALVVMASVPGSVLSSTARLVEAAGDTWPFPDATSLDTWLAVQADGTVIVTTGKVEIGNGSVMTGLAQIVAEELDVAFSKITMVMGDTARCVDQGGTNGSGTIRRAGPQMQQMAADARYALVQMAAAALNTAPDKLVVNDGVVSLPGTSQSISYASLIGGKQFNQKIPISGNGTGFTVGGQAKPKSTSQYKIVGSSVPRADIPDKVTAKFTYIQDVTVPGMLHGRTVRPAGIGSNVLSVGAAPKGAQVVQVKNFVGVVAKTEWQAVKAAKALKVQWSDWNGLPASASAVYDALRQQPVNDRVVATNGPDVSTALAGAAKTLTATYLTPFQMHGSLGPCCAIADVRADEAIVYSGTSDPGSMRQSIATYLNLDISKVHVIWYPASGDYGTNGLEDVTLDAVIMSKSVGAPVRVQWMRWDNHGWEPKGPAIVSDLKAGLDAAGNLVAWDHQAWNPPDSDDMIAPSVLAGNPVGNANQGGWAGPMVYNFASSRQLNHRETNLGYDAAAGSPGIVTTFLRAPAQIEITFAMESFMDEIAASIGADPVQFRLKYLTNSASPTNQRLIDLIRAVVAQAQWETRSSPGPQAQSKGHIVTGRGFAISNRSNTLNAEAAWVTVNKQTGKVTVDRFLVGQDNGLTINPRQVQLQIESGIMQTISRALYEEVQMNSKNITSLDWQSYPIARFLDVPASIDTVLIDHPEFPATGVGEPMCCPVFAAIGNAIFDATGVRLRQTPFRASRVKAALKAAGVA